MGDRGPKTLTFSLFDHRWLGPGRLLRADLFLFVLIHLLGSQPPARQNTTTYPHRLFKEVTEFNGGY